MFHVRSRALGAAAALLCSWGWHGAASAQASDPFIGQIMCAAFNFEPKGWAALNGQLLPIAQNTALFALIGTIYGGNGVTNFALPDMRSRVAVHNGQGPGLSNREIGESAGAEQVVLSNSQLPVHSHSVTPLGSSADATLVSPANAVPSTKSRTTLYAPGPGSVGMAPVFTSIAGGSQPVPVMQPFLTVNCFIALQGVFPSRN